MFFKAALSFVMVLSVISTVFSKSLESRLGVPFGITANDDCGSSPGALNLAASVASYDAIIFQWPELKKLKAAIIARATQARAKGLKVSIAMSPTKLTGLRTEIDLPKWVASDCRLKDATASFRNACLRDHFIADAVDLATAIQPDHFQLGTEINTLLLRGNPLEFVLMGQLYQAAHPAVKAVSPKSKVFVSFLYELQLRIDEDQPTTVKQNWDDTLNAFRGDGPSLLDLVGFTSYPSSNFFITPDFESPSDIPNDFYAKAAAHLKPEERVVITEIGWPTQSSGTETEQSDFLNRLPDLIAPAKPVLVTWALLHDVRIFGENLDLGTVGVRNCDGTPKPGWSILLK